MRHLYNKYIHNCIERTRQGSSYQVEIVLQKYSGLTYIFVSFIRRVRKIEKGVC